MTEELNVYLSYLKDLREKGVITEQEYSKAKQHELDTLHSKHTETEK